MSKPESSCLDPVKLFLLCLGAFLTGTLLYLIANRIFGLSLAVRDIIYNTLVTLTLFLAILHRPKSPTSRLLVIAMSTDIISLLIYFVFSNYYVYFYRLHLFYTMIVLVPIVILFEIGMVRPRTIVWIALSLLAVKITADLILEIMIRMDRFQSLISLFINLENYLCIILMGIVGIGFCLFTGYWIWLRRPTFLPTRFIKLILLGCAMNSLMMVMKGYFATYTYYDAAANNITASFSVLPLLVWITAFLISHCDDNRLDRRLMIAAQITLHLLFAYVLFSFVSGAQDSMKLLLSFAIYLTFQIFILLAVLIHHIHESSLEKSRELLNLNDRLFGIMQSVHDAVFVIDSRGLIQDLNFQAERLIELDRQSLINTPFNNLLHSGDDAEQDGSIHFKVIKPDGRQTIVAIKEVEVEMGGERFRVSALRDLTLLKREQEQKMRLQEQFILNEKREMMSKLISGMGHDFNNYLSSIVGYTHLLMSHLNANEKLLKYAQSIGLSAEHATKTMHRILSATSQNRQPEISDVDVNHSLKDLVQLLKGMNSNTIRIDLQLTQDLPAILVDPFELIRCLLNLARNGIKAMPDGGILTVRSSYVPACDLKNISVDVNDHSDKDYVMIEIGDAGCGIPESIRHRVFDPYFSTRSSNEGVGLGLSIVLNIVRSFEGFISFESEVGKGTTFRVLFPVNHDVISRPGPEPRLVLPNALRIFVMMCHDAHQNLVEQSLSSLGYHYETISPIDFDSPFHRAPDFILLAESLEIRKSGILLSDILERFPLSRMICFGADFDLSKYSTSRVRFLEKPIQVEEFLAVLRSLVVSVSISDKSRF